MMPVSFYVTDKMKISSGIHCRWETQREARDVKYAQKHKEKIQKYCLY